MSVVPLTLIPQIILAGVLVPLPDMNEIPRGGSYLMASRWANQALEASLFQGRTIDSDLLTNEANLRPLWNLYPDDNLNSDDGRKRFLHDHLDTSVERRETMIEAFLVLTLFTVMQLGAVGVVLRRQDAF
jgi:hypothetical protein